MDHSLIHEISIDSVIVIYIQIVEKIKYVMGYSPCLGSAKVLCQSDMAEIYRMAR